MQLRNGKQMGRACKLMDLYDLLECTTTQYNIILSKDSAMHFKQMSVAAATNKRAIDTSHHSDVPSSSHPCSKDSMTSLSATMSLVKTSAQERGRRSCQRWSAAYFHNEPRTNHSLSSFFCASRAYAAIHRSFTKP